MRLHNPIAAIALLIAVAPGLALAQYESKQGKSPSAADEDVTREDVQQKKRELREMERELRRKEREEQEAARDDEPRRAQPRRGGARAWIGASYGVMYGSAEVACAPSTFGDDCTEEGIINTYGANITVANDTNIFRLRGMRDADKGDERRTPYEQAALVGARFGHSDWYGMVGYGRIRHVDDRFTDDRAQGFAWEIIFAPSARGLTGLELSFHGNSGDEVDIVGFNIGLRIGALD
jgi:hypothetical protein